MGWEEHDRLKKPGLELLEKEKKGEKLNYSLFVFLLSIFHSYEALCIVSLTSKGIIF